MTPLERLYLVLADALLVVHAAFVGFVVIGLALVWIGGWRRWGFVRNLWFRVMHLAAIGVVVAESLMGFVCPLTTWENRLRVLAGSEQRYEGTFVQHWLHQVLFHDFSPRVFTIAYVVFFGLVALSFWFIPPRRRGRSRVPAPNQPRPPSQAS